MHPRFGLKTCRSLGPNERNSSVNTIRLRVGGRAPAPARRAGTGTRSVLMRPSLPAFVAAACSRRENEEPRCLTTTPLAQPLPQLSCSAVAPVHLTPYTTPCTIHAPYMHHSNRPVPTPAALPQRAQLFPQLFTHGGCQRKSAHSVSRPAELGASAQPATRAPSSRLRGRPARRGVKAAHTAQVTHSHTRSAGPVGHCV